MDLVIHGPTLVIAGCFGFPKNDTPARLANLHRRLACGKDTTGSAYSYCFPQQLFVLLFDHPPQDHLSMNPSILPGVTHSKQLPGGWKRGRQPVCLLVFVLSSTAPKLPSLRPPSSTKHRQECQHRIEPANSQGNLASCERTPTSCNQSSPVSVSAVCLVRLVQHIVQSSKCVSWPICFSSDK